MSKLWLLLLLAVFVCLLLDCEAQNNRRRNRNRNRNAGDAATDVGGRGNRRGQNAGRRRPSASGGDHMGRGHRGRGGRRPARGRRPQGPGRGVAMLNQATQPFSLNLYKELARTQPNVIVSTYSILTALSMVSLGAQGQTLEELRTAMGMSALRPRKAHKAFQSLARALEASTSGNVTLAQANAIFARQGLRIRSGFSRKLRKFYSAEMKNFEMSHPEGPEKPINDWVAQNTNNMIQDFLPPNTITPLTVIWLLNAIYFKGLWKTPFETRLTRRQPFYLSNSDQTTVDMMFRSGRFPSGHSRELGARVLEVPYAGDAVSMFILLPEEIEGLALLENNLTPDLLETALTSVRPSSEIELSLPKMKVEFEADLKEPLQRLGIRRMFDMSQAELRGMLMDRSQLYVSDGKHKAVLEVTEEGTAASAATGIGISLMSLPIAVPEFNVNHPFMFVIRDKIHQVNLFVGKYTDPRRAM